MSVINSMLKELDKRQQSHELENLNVAPVQYQAKSSTKLPWVLLAIVSVLLLCGIAYSWQALSSAQQRSLNHPSSQLFTVAKPDVASMAEFQISEADAQFEQAKASSVEIPKASMEDKIADASDEVDTSLVQAARSSEKSVLSMKATEEPIPTNLQATESDIASVITLTAAHVTTSVVKSEPIPDVVKPVALKPSSMAITEVKISNEQLALRRYRLATEAENQGLLSDAIVYYSEVLALTPAMHKARRQLAALYYGQGRLDTASDILIKGTVLFPEEYDYAFLLARVQQASGDIKLAMSSLETIPDESLLAKPKWTMQSSLAQKNKNYPLAEESYRKLLGIEAGQARWWMGLGYALDSQLEYDSAKQAYRQALSAEGLSKQAKEYIENRLVQLGESE